MCWFIASLQCKVFLKLFVNLHSCLSPLLSSPDCSSSDSNSVSVVALSLWRVQFTWPKASPQKIPLSLRKVKALRWNFGLRLYNWDTCMSFSSLIFIGISWDNSTQDNMFLAVSAPRRLFIISVHLFMSLDSACFLIFFLIFFFTSLIMILTLKATLVVNVAGHFQCLGAMIILFAINLWNHLSDQLLLHFPFLL